MLVELNKPMIKDPATRASFLLPVAACERMTNLFDGKTQFEFKNMDQGRNLKPFEPQVRPSMIAFNELESAENAGRHARRLLVCGFGIFRLGSWGQWIPKFDYERRENNARSEKCWLRRLYGV